MSVVSDHAYDVPCINLYLIPPLSIEARQIVIHYYLIFSILVFSLILPPPPFLSEHITSSYFTFFHLPSLSPSPHSLLPPPTPSSHSTSLSPPPLLTSSSHSTSLSPPPLPTSSPHFLLTPSSSPPHPRPLAVDIATLYRRIPQSTLLLYHSHACSRPSQGSSPSHAPRPECGTEVVKYRETVIKEHSDHPVSEYHH